jgi:hypothetical protein
VILIIVLYASEIMSFLMVNHIIVMYFVTLQQSIIICIMSDDYSASCLQYDGY